MKNIFHRPKKRSDANDFSSEGSGNKQNTVFISGSVTKTNIQVDVSHSSAEVKDAGQYVNLPTSNDVNMKQVVADLKIILTSMSSEDSKKIANALEDAEDELNKDNPNKDEVGEAIDRALNKARKAQEFATVVDDLRPHVEAAAGWLGKNWYKILSVISLAA